jgi:eukaryotic-like serine/threonine-protein kinase
MPMKDDEEEQAQSDEWAPAAHISRDGKIEGLFLPKDQRRDPETWVQPPIDLPLELDHKPPATQDEPPPPAPRKPANLVPILVSLGVVLACGAVIFFLVHKPHRAALVEEPEPAEKLVVPDAPEGAPSLTVQSDPPGATVFVEGEESGSTPLLGSNEFGKGTQVKIRLELKGYEPWLGSFQGGANATIRARLKRK